MGRYSKLDVGTHLQAILHPTTISAQLTARGVLVPTRRLSPEEEAKVVRRYQAPLRSPPWLGCAAFSPSDVENIAPAPSLGQCSRWGCRN
jgi:hypothetical protein